MSDAMTNRETRRFERHETHQTIFYRTGAETAYTKGKTHNISKNGLLMESGACIAKGSDLELVLNFHDTPVHFKGTCVFCQGAEGEGYHSGIHVTKISTAGMQAFLAFIGSLEKKENGNPLGLRPETAAMENIVQRTAAEHKIVLRYMVALKEMVAVPGSPLALAELDAILGLMQRDLRTHFDIEEKIFFKIGLTHLPTDHHGLIAELTREHTLLNRQLEQLMDSVQVTQGHGVAGGDGLRETIEGFLALLKEHARKEITDLFPVLEANAEVKSTLMATLGGIVTG